MGEAAIDLINQVEVQFEKFGRIIAPADNPTKTKTLEERFKNQVTARYNALKRAITKSIVKNDCFGLRLRNVEEIAPIAEGALAGFGMTEQVRRFGVWLNAAIASGVLEIVQTTGEPWSDPFIETAFSRGIIQGNINVRAIGATIQPVGPQQIAGVLGSPAVNASLQLELNRYWTAFEGVNAQMQMRIENILSEGLEAGLGPNEIARQINAEVEGIGEVRSRLIARTEIIRSHNLGSLAEHRRLSAEIGEEIYSQWWATLDNRVRDNHLARHGKIFIDENARRLLGEPNCRCALLPYIESIEGKADLADPNRFLKKKDSPAIKGVATKRRKRFGLEKFN